MPDLFGNDKNQSKLEESYTLADRMRPRKLSEILGQQHIIGQGKPLRRLISSGDFGSMIFWGPPGSGKTTLVNIIANESKVELLSYSAVLSGIKQIKEVIRRAGIRLQNTGKRSILFIDEIHRFNKAQQDAFLPFVEKGSIVLIGATTENPSFEIISPLLSRTQVFILKGLTKEDIITILKRAISDKERGLGDMELDIEEGVLENIAELSSGDARYALTVLEFVANASEEGRITMEGLSDLIQRQRLHYDKAGEEHYNLISALHKAIRGSDPDGAIYWLARMLASGEDRLYILRRLIRMAMEDIGLADPNAIRIAIASRDTFQYLGEPEGDLVLTQLAVYLAAAPKSNSLYMAHKKVMSEIKKGNNPPVPIHLRNAPTKLMKDIGYGEEYKYAHDYEGHIVEQEFLPDELKGKKFYYPSNQGLEGKIKSHLKKIQEIFEMRRKNNNDGKKR
ncbi:MAG: replication-associated recombination protein A [Candidatus Zixiibacteriota bacterium]